MIFISDPERSYSADLHIHSLHSFDGIMSVGRIIGKAKELGLSAVAICDHNSFEGSREAMLKNAGLIIVPAAEYSTEFGHMLAYFIGRDASEAGITPNGHVYRFDEICAFVKDEGGLLFYAHPYRNGAPKRRALQLCDGLEVLNGRNTARKDSANADAVELADLSGVPFSAGSDAHMPGEIGRSRFYFEAESGTPALSDIRRALETRNARAEARYQPSVFSRYNRLRLSVRARNAKLSARNLLKLLAAALWDAAHAPFYRGRTYKGADMTK